MEHTLYYNFGFTTTHCCIVSTTTLHYTTLHDTHNTQHTTHVWSLFTLTFSVCRFSQHTTHTQHTTHNTQYTSHIPPENKHHTACMTSTIYIYILVPGFSLFSTGPWSLFT